MQQQINDVMCIQSRSKRRQKPSAKQTKSMLTVAHLVESREANTRKTNTVNGQNHSSKISAPTWTDKNETNANSNTKTNSKNDNNIDSIKGTMLQATNKETQQPIGIVENYVNIDNDNNNDNNPNANSCNSLPKGNEE